MDDFTLGRLLEFNELKQLKTNDPREQWLIDEAKKYLWNKLERTIPKEILEKLLKGD